MREKQIPKEINTSKNTMKYKNTSIIPRKIQVNTVSMKQEQGATAFKLPPENKELYELKVRWEK